jgi:hypothetical protein
VVNQYSWGQIRILLQQFAGPGTKLDTIDHAIRGRYELILSAMNWKGIEGSGYLETTAAYNTGTITLTPGSTAGVGVGTSWTAAMNGWQLFLGYGPLYTATIVDGTSLTLDRPFEGGTSGPYWLAQAYYDLPDNCRELRSVGSPVNGALLDAIDEDVFGELEGSFLAINCPATDYVLKDDGVDSQTGETVQRVLLYPVPTLAQGYPITFDLIGEGFDGSSTTDGPLAFVSSAAIIAGAKADLSKDANEAMRWESRYEAHLNGQIHVENGKHPNERMRLESSYTRHRIQRVLRSSGPLIARNLLLDDSADLATGAGTFKSEAPAGVVNGTNAIFTVSFPPLTPVIVTVNGTLKLLGTDYNASGLLIVFLGAAIPTTGQAVLAQYTY